MLSLHFCISVGRAMLCQITGEFVFVHITLVAVAYFERCLPHWQPEGASFFVTGAAATGGFVKKPAIRSIIVAARNGRRA
jgi:hypothetical protein